MSVKRTPSPSQAEAVVPEPSVQPAHPLPQEGGCFTIVDGVPVRDPDPETQTEA